LIIPKYHSEKLDEVPDQYLADLLPLAKKIAQSTGHADYNLLQNNGKMAFQHVPHVHLHLIPKPNVEDGMIFRPEDISRKVERPMDELGKILENMRAALSKL